MLVEIGRTRVSEDALMAHLYLQLAEYPPENAPDEWFAPRGSDGITIASIREEFPPFLRGVSRIVDRLQEVEEDETEIQAIFYDEAKATFGEDKKSIRKFFRLLYIFLFDVRS
jgi:hypothetical protein